VIGRLAFVFVASMLVAGATAAQTASPEAKSAIELKLSSTSLMMCVGSSLPLTVELTNRGVENVKVDKSAIWNTFGYGFMGNRQFRGGGMGSSCSHCQPDFVVLTPDQKYTSSFNFDLKNDFFKDAGKYDIQLMFAGAQSNELEFELFSCQ